MNDETFARAQDCERDLDKLVSELGFAEDGLATASKKRDEILGQIQEAERQLAEVRDEVTADTLAGFTDTKSNKEVREAKVASELRKDEKFVNFDRQVCELKIDQRNILTSLELATSRVKSLHRRVDAAVARAGLIRSQLDTIATYERCNTAKLQMGATKR